MANDTSSTKQVIDHVEVEKFFVAIPPHTRVVYGFYTSDGKLVNDMDAIKYYIATNDFNDNPYTTSNLLINSKTEKLIKLQDDSLLDRMFDGGRKINHVIGEKDFDDIKKIKDEIANGNDLNNDAGSNGDSKDNPRDWTTFTKMYEGENAPNNEPATPAFSGAVTDSESVRIYKVKTFINGFTPPGEYGEEQLIKMLYAKFVSPSCSTLFNNFQNTMKETIEGVIVPTLDDVMNTLNATNSNQYMSTGDGDAITNGERLKTAKTNIEAFKTHMLSLTQEEFANTLNTYNEKFKEGKKKTRVYLLKKQANEVINPEERPTGEENLEGIVWLKQSSPPAEYKGEQINDFKRKKYWFEGPVDSFENPDTGEITYAYKKINRPIYYIAPEVIESALDSGENHERLESAELNCPQRTKYDPGSVVMEVGM